MRVFPLEILDQLLAYVAPEIPGLSGSWSAHQGAQFQRLLGALGDLEIPDLLVPQVGRLEDTVQFLADFVTRRWPSTL